MCDFNDGSYKSCTDACVTDTVSKVPTISFLAYFHLLYLAQLHIARGCSISVWAAYMYLNEEVGYKRAAPRAEAMFKNGVAYTSCMVNFMSSSLPAIYT